MTAPVVRLRVQRRSSRRERWATFVAAVVTALLSAYVGGWFR